MDYLVIEGYKTAAEEFSVEANVAPHVPLSSIESRVDIREALQRGDVEDAINRLNDLAPEVSITFFYSLISLCLSIVYSASGDGDGDICKGLKRFMHHSQSFWDDDDAKNQKLQSSI
jgi:hypothetical protein